MRVATLATCSLSQWALDFDGNLERIRASVREAKARGARVRVGPELEIPGYGCEDAFLEGDTERHAWEVLAALLEDDLTDGILCDFGLPVTHAGVRYNARAFALDRTLWLVRPKRALADDGAYRESRWFAAWARPRMLETLSLPTEFRRVTGQEAVPIGDGALRFEDARLASESCEELFTPEAPHVPLGLAGVEIFANGSASHHQLRKLEERLQRIRAATLASGGVYLYANARGADGGRFYYDGGSMIALNGRVLAQGAAFSPHEVEVVHARVDLDEIARVRTARPSAMRQAARAPEIPWVAVPFALATDLEGAAATAARPLHVPEPMEEIDRGPALWSWDYLRRSGSAGFFLPLSGGADSAAVATVVHAMSHHLCEALASGSEEVGAALRRVLRLPDDAHLPADARALTGRLLTTAYLAGEHSSPETATRARRIAEAVGATHLQAPIDGTVEALLQSLEKATGAAPRFAAQGGSEAEDAALQNLQARSRMVLGYLLAQGAPDAPGPRLVLGTANVDEALVGYVTKYDASSADLNPIGGLSKIDLRRYLQWAADRYVLPVLAEVAGATPTAELVPAGESGPQSDEADVGLAYAELSRLGVLRKVEGCGPLETYLRLTREWSHLAPHQVAARVKRFYRAYARNRHKAVVATPAYHAERYDPDDHRYDPRPFLLRGDWPWQFRAIDRHVAAHPGSEAQGGE